MKIEEKIANKYLEQLGLGSPVFEPDGNIPPDFILSPQTAIEVMRLSQSLPANSIKSTTVENIYIPFWRMLKKVLSTFDSQYNNKSYLIIIAYDTPLAFSKFNEKEIFHKLRIFLDSKDIELPHTLTVNNGISLHIDEIKPITGCTFKLASWGFDPGPITTLYIDNLQRCITKKSNKIKHHKHKYPKWQWQLLLVDSMNWSLDIEEVEKIKASITDLGLFDSLAVIDYESKLLFSI